MNWFRAIGRSELFLPLIGVLIGLMSFRSTFETAVSLDITLVFFMLWVLLWWWLIRRTRLLAALVMIPVTLGSTIALISWMQIYESFNGNYTLFIFGFAVTLASFSQPFIFVIEQGKFKRKNDEKASL